MDRLSVLFLRLLLSLQRLQHLLWWLLELHILKLVSSYIMWVCVKEVSPSCCVPERPSRCVLRPAVRVPQVCLFNLVFVLCVGGSLACRRRRPLLSGVCTVWTCVVTVCKMLYQLSAVRPDRYSATCRMVTVATAAAAPPPPRAGNRACLPLQPENCSAELAGSALYAGAVDPSQWAGLRKTDGKVLDYLRVSGGGQLARWLWPGC